MPIFGSGSDSNQKKRAEVLRGERQTDAVVEQELAELTAERDPRELTKAASEADAVITEAARNELRDYKLLEQGRCPQCSSRTESFLYTVICPTCGWYRRSVPETGRSLVYLSSGQEIHCDYVHTTTGGDFLCIQRGVVITQVMRQQVTRIEYLWEAGELDAAREQLRQRRAGICSWCEQDLSELEDGQSPLTDYVAFGMAQERYVFCGEKCMGEFRKQYPSRIHRNCYETDCDKCQQCVKRFDVDGFRRTILR